MNMSPNKPYLIRAIYDWIVDNELTPYLLVNGEYPGIHIPQDYVRDGRIILNISPKACRGLHLDNDKIVFTGRFSGESMQLFIVPAAVIAIYAKENGRGMEFMEEPENSESAGAIAKPNSDKQVSKKPALKLVKKED